MRMTPLALIALLFAGACAKAPVGGALSEPAPSTESPTASPSPAEPGRRLLYATKSGTEVTVRTIDLETGRQETVLIYDEAAPAEHSQNHWEELPPSVALSPDGRRLAYGAADGLYLFDIARRERKALIARTAERAGDTPPSWSPPLEPTTYGLYEVRWSGDGRYLSFEQSHYEGNSIGFFDLEGVGYFRQAGLPLYSYADPTLGTPAWAATGAQSVVAVSGSAPGIVVSAPAGPARARLIELDHPRITAAAPSADGSHVAFLFDDHEGDWKFDGVGVVRRDGSEGRIIDHGGEKSSVRMDADDNVWWVERGTVYRWSGSATAVAARADDTYAWEIFAIDDATLSLIGRSREAGRGSFLLLDRATGDPVATHTSSTDFVTYLGLMP